jgi:signal transduction histidine kinase
VSIQAWNIIMTLSLRSRLILTLAPLLVLMAILGGAAAWLLYRLGGRVDAILRENYDSVLYMERLNEALERIDSSFQFALVGEPKAEAQYQTNWDVYWKYLKAEQTNITIEGEGELVDRLTSLTQKYHALGDAFYARRAADQAKRRNDYFKKDGLYDTFQEIKTVSGQILRLNQDNMEKANKEARQTAEDSLIWFGAGLLAAVVVAGLLAWQTHRALLQPIQAVTQSALAIGMGNFDQVVPSVSLAELGQLADAFNTMARQMRQYRQVDYARLLRAQRTSQATIDSFPDPVLVVDLEGGVEMANPVARRLFGVTAAKAGQTANVPWQPPEILRKHLTEALHNQRPYRPEGFDHAFTLRVDNQDRFFLPFVLPIQDPYSNTLGAAVLLQDVTRFRLLDEVKNDLVATVSHELKTPLTSLRLALHLLLEEIVGPLTPKQAELLLDARENAERLLARINNLLDLARLERGREQLDLQPEQPAALLQEAAASIRPRADDKGVAVCVEAAPDLPSVSVDRQRLNHALGNLLDNALKYTERGGRITLTGSADVENVTLTVADTGVGIPPESLPHIFEKFYRIPGQSRDGSTGLGLAIVREIVTAHGGAITCDSQPGAGTVFRLTLPIWKG